MSEDNKQNEVTSAGFKSPYTEPSDKVPAKQVLTSLSLGTHNLDAVATTVKAETRIKEIQRLLKSEQSNAKREELKKELEAISSFKDVLAHTSRSTFYNENMFGLFDEVGDWTQAIKLEGKVLGTKVARIRAKTDGDGYVSGIQNIRSAFSKTGGVGIPNEVMLPHSCITVTLGNASERDLLRLVIMLEELQNELGFNTRGLMFTTNDTKILCTIAEFCLSHVVSSTMRSSSMEDLMKVYDPRDTMALAAGMLNSVYPEGYPFFHTCINKEECKYNTFSSLLDTGKLDGVPRLLFNRLTWYNWKKIDARLFRFLGAAPGTHTVEQVQEMREAYNVPTRIGPFNQDGSLIYMVIKSPDYLDYRRMTYEWIADVSNSVDEAMRKTSNEANMINASRKRRDNLNRAVGSLSLMIHLPWVEEVHIEHPDEDVIKVRGASDVAEALEMLCSNPEVLANADKTIMKARNAATLTMTGIPIFECPSCGTIQQEKTELHEYNSIIPRNVLSDFFYTMVSRFRD